MAIKEFNVDLDVKGRILASIVPNSTGSIVTWNTTTNVFGLRTNAQIISDLNLSSNFITSNTAQTGLTGNKTSNGIWTLGQVRKAGQSDTQMLLAGGGHRPVSDFALASEIPNVTGFIPYTGANQSIDLNTQDFTTGGYTNRLHSYFERINLASDSTSAYSNFKLLTNVASSEIGNASSQTSDIIITLPITTSTHWQAEIDILLSGYRTTLNVGGYGTVSSSRFVNSVYGDISDIIEVKFGRIGDSTVLIIKRSNSSNHRLQVNISKFYYHHTNSVDLYNNKTKYKVEYINESELTNFTLNGVVVNSQFRRDSYYLDYNNFTNTPTIPTVNNGQLTLSTGSGLSGSSTFTANQSGSSSFSVAVASTHKLPTTAEWNALSTQTLSGSTSNLIVSNTIQRAALTGDVTANQNSNATTIANSAVTHAKYQNIATQRILGRGATGSGNVQELTLGANLSLSTSGVLSSTNTNTTYSEITVAESNSLTSTIGRLITGRRLNSWGNSKYLPLTGGTLEDGATPLFIKRAATQVSLGFEVGVTRRFLGINAIGDLIFGNDANINSTGNVVWHKGNLANGTTAQYIRGDGTLATFPTLPTGNATHTGDVTGATVLTIANKAVTLAKMADLAANSLIGRGSGTGVPQRLTLGNKLSISGTEINATDTTYNAGTLALLNAGTNTTNRVWGAKPIADYVKQYAGENLGLQGVTDIGNHTDNTITFGNSAASPNTPLFEIGFKTFGELRSYAKGLTIVNSSMGGDQGLAFSGSDRLTLSNVVSGFSLGAGGYLFEYKRVTGIGTVALRTDLHKDERGQSNTLQFPPEDGTLATREWMASPGNEPPSSEPGVSLIRAGEIARYLFRNNFAINHSTKIIDAVDTKYTAGTNVSISASNVISATNTNTTYSQASLAQLKAGTNTSNRLINPMHFKEAVEYIIKPKQILVTATVSYGLDNGATFILNGASAAIGTGTLSEIDTGAEYYIYNNTNSEKSIYGGTGVTYKQSSGTTTATVKIKANGAATIIRIGSTGTFLALGDITT